MRGFINKNIFNHKITCNSECLRQISHLCHRKANTQRSIHRLGICSVMLQDMSTAITGISLLESHSTSNHSTKAHFDFGRLLQDIDRFVAMLGAF